MAKKPPSLILNGNQVSALSDVIKETNSFTIHVYNTLSKANPKVNMVMSPVLFQMVMTMAFSGASGKTADEIADLFKIPKDVKKALEGCQALSLVLKDPSMLMGSKIFFDASVKTKDSFGKSISQYFEYAPEKVNFKSDSKGAKNIINSWAEKAADIRDYIADREIDSHTIMLLAIALYGRANWDENFSVGATMTEDFNVTEKNTIEVEMMFKSSFHNYTNHEGLNAKIVQLPYDKGTVSMFCFLPNEIGGLPKLEKALVKFDLVNELNKLKTQVVDVFLPKFEIAQPLRINELLVSFGAKEIFDAKSGGFSGIADGDVSASKIYQKVIIEVAERGIDKNSLTKTRASFELKVDDDEDNERFKADHPFLFMVTKKIQNQLFIVQIGKFTGKR